MEVDEEREVLTDAPLGPKDPVNVGNSNNSTVVEPGVDTLTVDGDVVVGDERVDGPRTWRDGATEVPLGPKDPVNVGNSNNSTGGFWATEQPTVDGDVVASGQRDDGPHPWEDGVITEILFGTEDSSNEGNSNNSTSD